METNKGKENMNKPIVHGGRSAGNFKNRIVSVFCYPTELVVRNKTDAKTFLDCIKPNESVEIPNVKQMRNRHPLPGGDYWLFERSENGLLRYCYSHYARPGEDALTAQPCVMINSPDEKLAVEAVYSARQSVNEFLKK